MPSSTRASSPQHCAQRSLSTRAKQRQRYHRRTATAIPSVSLCHIQTAGQHATDWRKGSQLSRDIKSKCSGKNTAFSYEPLYSEWRQILLCIYIEFIHLKKIYKKIFIFVLRWKRSQCVTLKSKPEGTYHIISAFFFFCCCLFLFASDSNTLCVGSECACAFLANFVVVPAAGHAEQVLRTFK